MSNINSSRDEASARGGAHDKWKASEQASLQKELSDDSCDQDEHQMPFQKRTKIKARPGSQ